MKAKTAVLIILVAAFCFILSSPGTLQAQVSAASLAQNASSVIVHYIDVGQGDSIFIDTADKDVLIDGGPGSAGTSLVSYLTSLGVAHIHLMVATHMHSDHIGGLVNVLSSTLTVDEILVNNQPCDTAACTNFMSLAESHTITVAQRGQVFQLTSTTNLTILNPVQPLEFSEQNDNSVVAMLRVGSVSFLFTGDAEQAAEQSMTSAGLNLKADVLKVGHHGSRTATSQPFLDAVAPAYAVISAGENNPYGHPHEETMQKLLSAGVAVYATFHSGTIIASTNGTTITFPSNPEPIPEPPAANIILTLLALTTICIAALHKTKREGRRNIHRNKNPS